MWQITHNGTDVSRDSFGPDAVAYDESGFSVDIDDLYGDDETQQQLADNGYGDRASRRILIWASEEESDGDDGSHAIACAVWSGPDAPEDIDSER